MTTRKFSFEAIGTHWIIELFGGVSQQTAAALQRATINRIDAFDKNYSRFRPDSLVSRMSREPGRYELPDDAKPLLDLYHGLYDITNGSMTPLIGRTLEQAGYDAHYSLQAGKLTPPPAWHDVLEYSFPYLTLKQPALLDFGAAGKGYLADIIATLLDGHGVQAYCINAGGDIVCRAPAGTAVDLALEHPADPEMAIGVAHLSHQSLCGSAGNRRAWGDFHHIINPHSLSSPRQLAGVWVTAESGLLADGLTTAIFFTSPEVLQQHFVFEYALIREDYHLDHSANFPADFFTSDIHEKLR